jgi:hypothetical protein
VSDCCMHCAHDAAFAFASPPCCGRRYAKPVLWNGRVQGALFVSMGDGEHDEETFENLILSQARLVRACGTMMLQQQLHAACDCFADVCGRLGRGAGGQGGCCGFFRLSWTSCSCRLLSSREKKGIRPLDQSPRLWHHCAFDCANRL